MGFLNFGGSSLLFLAIIIDLAGDCIDFAIAFGNQKREQKRRKMQKLEQNNKVEQLEKRSLELEQEIAALKRELQRLTNSGGSGN